MIQSLADSLDVLCPDLASELVPSAVASRLRQLARALLPIYRCAFECRLCANAYQVDLSQCILPANGELEAVAAWTARMASRAAGTDHSAWSRAHAFFARWSDSAFQLHTGVRETWLEFDVEDHVLVTPPPSLFFALQREILPDRACMVVRDALDVLVGTPGGMPSALRGCIEACVDGVLFNQIGVMLSRHTDALRVCAQARGTESVVPYLWQVGWPGPVAELEHLLAGWLHHADADVMIDLDVSDCVQSKVGLEFCFGAQPEDRPRWTALLDALVDRRLCTLAKRDAVLKWPGKVFPTSGSVLWPERLIVESLGRPPDQFSVFVRRLLHVKVVYQPGQPLEAKVYLSFNHNWGRQSRTNSAGKDLS